MKKLISMALAVALCLSLMVTVPASAEGSAQSGDTLPGDYSGVVMKYTVLDAGKGIVGVECGTQNPNAFNTFAATIKFDSDVVELVDSSNTALSSNGAFQLKKAVITAQVEAGMIEGTDMVGAAILEDVMTYNGSNIGGRLTAGVDGPAYITIAPGINQGLGASNIDASGDWILAAGKQYKMATFRFRVKSGNVADVKSDTFGVYANCPDINVSTLTVAGSGIMSASKSIRNENFFMLGFPKSETPPPATTYATAFTVKNSSGALAQGASVRVYRSTPAFDQTKTTDSLGKASFDLENGSYNYTIALSGHQTQSGTTTVNSAAVTVPEVSLPAITGSSDPKYTLTGTYDETNEKLKVEVKIHNMAISAAYFGLKFDKRILALPRTNDDLDGFQMSEVVQKGSVNPVIPTYTPDNTDYYYDGYHFFSWLGTAPDNSTQIPGTAEGTRIATYTFNLSKADYESKLNKTSITIVPWGEVTGNFEDPTIWKIDASAPGGGYYCGVKQGENGVAYSLPYEISYPNDTKYEASFTVTSTATGNAPVSGAKITVKNSTGDLTQGTMTTDADGKAFLALQTGATYGYRVTDNNYWPNPEKESEQTSFAISNANKDLTVKLTPYVDRKISWDVRTGPVDNKVEVGTINGQALNAGTILKEGTDFEFSVTPKDGYQAGAPTASINGAIVNPQFDAAKDKFVLKGTDIKADVALSVSFTATQNMVSASVGTGGTLNSKTANITEQVNYGGSSTEFKYTANTGNEIDKIVINGATMPVDASTVAYNYTFSGVKAPQTIAVTFKAKGAESTSSVVSVSVGKNGKVAVTSPAVQTITGQASTDILLDKGAALKATITPNTDFIIDKVYVDGQKQTVSDTGTFVIGGSTGIAADGRNHSVIVTFKANGASTSSQYVVTSKVKAGNGTILPLGTKMYNAGETPEYEFTASALWHIKTVEVGTAGGALTDVTNAVTAAGNKYTFPALDSDMEVVVTFEEDGYAVQGTAGYQGKVTGATVEFTRQSDAKVVTMVTLPGTGAYSGQLPAGTYNIKVSKIGHLNYEITDFVVDSSASGPITIKQIALIPGNVYNEVSNNRINTSDSGQMADGLAGREPEKSNVDESMNGNVHVVNATDLSFVNNNFGKTEIKKTWTEFMAP